jgi:ABC-2 type transport system ATP-binding protein
MTIVSAKRKGPPLRGSGKQSWAVEAIALAKTFPRDVQAAKDITLHAEAGEIVGIVGPNGAGKSTTLKMLATLLRPTSGTAWINGIPLEDGRRIRSLLGIALQEVGLDPLMYGREHFEFQAAINRVDRRSARSRTDYLSERLDLTAYLDRRVGAYSGGTQRRLALALALLSQPEVVILDEPTAGLDPHARRTVWEMARELKSANRTLLFSTQYLEEADSLCDRIYLIDQGVIVADGSPDALKENLAKGSNVSASDVSLDDVFIHHTRYRLEPEPLERATMDLGTRMHRGGGKRWK